jgi:hypothetical protein
MRWGAAFCLCLALAGPAHATPRLSLIGAYQTPEGLSVDGAPFGGISGIDYDAKSGDWLMISDDRSDKAPARFYAARLDYDAKGVRGLTLTRVTPLRRDDGSLFPSSPSTEGERADAEAIRLDPLTRTLVWSSEGDRQRGFDPALRRMTLEGQPAGEIPLPRALHFDPSGALGARPNLTTEGLSFAPDGLSLWVSMEAPLFQDGPVASVGAGAWVRITKLGRQGGVLAQYAYRLDPIQVAPAAGKRADNGVSEILALDQHRLLVLERSGVENADGRFVYHCRLYLVDTRGVETVSEAPSLMERPPHALKKRLLVNFDRLPGVSPSNLEAMAWGPSLAGGERTLVLASDDNFTRDQMGQLVVFAVK